MRYHAKRLVAFLDEHTTFDPDTGTRRIGGVQVGAKDNTTLYRWRSSAKTVDLGDADAFLIRHDLTIWDYENWAAEHGLWPFAKNARRKRSARRKRPKQDGQPSAAR